MEAVVHHAGHVRVVDLGVEEITRRNVRDHLWEKLLPPPNPVAQGMPVSHCRDSAFSNVSVLPYLLHAPSQAQASRDDLVHFLGSLRHSRSLTSSSSELGGQVGWAHCADTCGLAGRR
jgi:hypothetical protein